MVCDTVSVPGAISGSAARTTVADEGAGLTSA
jgi:hypothetical protein